MFRKASVQLSNKGTSRLFATVSQSGGSTRSRSVWVTAAAGISAGGLLGYYLNQDVFFSWIPRTSQDSGAEGYRAELEKKLRSLQIVKNLQSDDRYREYVSWHQSDKEKIGKAFTAGTLSVPGGLTLSPLVFVNVQDKKAISVVHCGHRLVGLPMMIHGGVLGTLLDEALGRTAFLSTDGTGVTANLKINYKKPTIAHQFLVIKTLTERSEDNRKAWVAGTIETLDGKVLVDATALFVAPKKLKLKKMTDL